MDFKVEKIVERQNMKYFTFIITDAGFSLNEWQTAQLKREAVKYIGFCILYKSELYISQLIGYSADLQSIYKVDSVLLKKYDNMTPAEMYRRLEMQKDIIHGKYGIIDDYFNYFGCDSYKGILLDFLIKNEIQLTERPELEFDIECIVHYKEIGVKIDFTSRFGFTG